MSTSSFSDSDLLLSLTFSSVLSSFTTSSFSWEDAVSSSLIVSDFLGTAPLSTGFSEDESVSTFSATLSSEVSLASVFVIVLLDVFSFSTEPWVSSCFNVTSFFSVDVVDVPFWDI